MVASLQTSVERVVDNGFCQGWAVWRDQGLYLTKRGCEDVTRNILFSLWHNTMKIEIVHVSFDIESVIEI